MTTTGAVVMVKLCMLPSAHRPVKYKLAEVSKRESSTFSHSANSQWHVCRTCHTCHSTNERHTTNTTRRSTSKWKSGHKRKIQGRL